MIFFCEECGEKNHLVAGQIIDDMVRFRCESCSYDNVYPLAKKEKTSISIKPPDSELFDPVLPEPVLPEPVVAEPEVAESEEIDADLSNMARQVASTINRYPEATASFLVYRNTKILLSSKQTQLDKDRLIAISKALIENFGHGQALFNDLTEMMLVFDDSNILYRSVTKELGFAVICNDLPLPFRFKAALDQVMTRLRETAA